MNIPLFMWLCLFDYSLRTTFSISLIKKGGCKFCFAKMALKNFSFFGEVFRIRKLEIGGVIS